MNIPDIYKAFHPNREEYTFSIAPETLSKVDHITGQIANLNRYKKIEITVCIQSDNCVLKLDLNNRNNIKPKNLRKPNN